MKIFNSRFCSFAALALALLFLSCNNSFEPNAPFKPRLTVYSILSPDRPLQFVRIRSTYALIGQDGFKGADGTVKIRQDTLEWILAETTLVQPSLPGYAESVKVFTSPLFQPVPGGRYELDVLSPLGHVFANVTTPARSFLSLLGAGILQNPGSYRDDAQFAITVDFGNGGKGYLVHLYIDLEVLEDTMWVQRREESPEEFNSRFIIETARYPVLRPLPSTNRVINKYLNGGYVATLQNLRFNKYLDRQIVFKKVVFQSVLVEQNMYDYWNVTNAFQDKYSIRIDHPNYSNIHDGFGVFGAYVVDSATVVLPDDFPFNNK